MSGAKQEKKTTGSSSRDKTAAGPDYDVIVIGTGMGGSAAGGICAMHGLKTLILEKNPTPGGSCSYYMKNGYKVDTGTHLFIRGNKGPFGICTRRLGLGEPIKFLHDTPVTHVKGFNMDFEIPLNPLRWPSNFIKFLVQSRISPLEYPMMLKLLFDILFMSENKLEALDDISLEEFLCRYTDNVQMVALFSFLMGLYFILPPFQASAGESIWNTRKLIGDINLGYPKGGCSVIPISFLKGARNHGGELRLNSGVKQIMVENGRATGVILEDGKKITAKAVISTSSVRDTVLRMTGEEHFPQHYVERVRSLIPAVTATQAKIGVKKKLVKGGSLVGCWPSDYVVDTKDDKNKKIYEDLYTGRVSDLVPIYCPVPSNFDPELAPAGRQLLTVVAAAPTLDTNLVDSEDVWVERMMDAIHNMVPGLKENTEFCDVWKVSTLAAWIGKDNGSAITTGQTTGQVGIQRIPHETPVMGLYLAGDCAGPTRGVGTELACQSGMDCADVVQRHIEMGWLK